jgi:hypothetical protein
MNTMGRRWLVALLYVASCGGAAPGDAAPDGGPPALDAGPDRTPQPPQEGGTPPDAKPAPGDTAPLPARGAAIEIRLAAPLPVTSGDFRIETATLWIGRMSMESDRGGDDSSWRRDNVVADLGGAPLRYELPSAPPALYSGLRLELDPFGSNRGPGGGGGGGGNQGPGGGGSGGGGGEVSLSLTGHTAGGAAFVLTDRNKVELELRAEGAELGAGSRLVCVLHLDVAGWLAGVIAPAGGSAIVIDGDHDPQDVARFEANLAARATLTFEAAR